MPYIAPARAASLAAGNRMLVPGDLAFILSEEIARYCRAHQLNFQTISDVRGATAAALNEFERRVVEPYEQGKIEAGGADPYVALADAAQDALCAGIGVRIAEHDRRRKQ
jgi:hypothetical protein